MLMIATAPGNLSITSDFLNRKILMGLIVSIYDF